MQISHDCSIDRLQDRALIALQGPAAEAVLSRRIPGIASMRFMDVRTLRVGDPADRSALCFTGEDGFEISIPGEKAGTSGAGAA
jgi:aminomethyltransferase